MRIKSIETSGGCGSGDGPDLVVRQTFTHRSRLFRAVVLAGASGLLLLPFAVLAATDGVWLQAGLLAANHPLVALQLLVVFFLALGAFIVGGCQLLRPAMRGRTVAFDGARVSVEDDFGGAVVQWEEAIDAFHGLRHHVSTTSEGVLHTLALEHSRPSRSVLIAADRYIDQAVIQNAAARFNKPVLVNKPMLGLQQSASSRSLQHFGRILQGAAVLKARARGAAGNA